MTDKCNMSNHAIYTNSSCYTLESFFFRNEMGCSNHAMVKCPKSLESLKPNNVIFHSSIKNLVGLTENVVIEYTSLNFANDIGMESIISNNIFPSGVRVPAKSFLHTVVIRDEDYPLYVTVAFGVEDNLKKCCNSRSDTKSLKYAGLPFNEALDKLNLLQVSKMWLVYYLLFVNFFVTRKILVLSRALLLGKSLK